MRAPFRLLTMLLVVAAAMLPVAALADDWLVARLRGQVLQLVDGAWAPLRRGDIVPDDRVLRSMATGRAELRRGTETIRLEGGTQVQIHDRQGKRFTTVQQYFGTVTIDAEARNVEHFAVQTPYLAAVVKGTRFAVTTDKSGTVVSVSRGRVSVTSRSSGERTTLSAGEAASADERGTLILGDTVEQKAATAGAAGNNGLHLGQLKNGNNGNGGKDNGNGNGNGNGGNGNGNGNGGNGNSGNGNNGNGGNGNGGNSGNNGKANGRSGD